MSVEKIEVGDFTVRISKDDAEIEIYNEESCALLLLCFSEWEALKQAIETVLEKSEVMPEGKARWYYLRGPALVIPLEQEQSE